MGSLEVKVISEGGHQGGLPRESEVSSGAVEREAVDLILALHLHQSDSHMHVCL